MPEVSQFIKPELDMPYGSSEANQSNNIQCVKGRDRNYPWKLHVASIIQGFSDMQNYSKKNRFVKYPGKLAGKCDCDIYYREQGSYRLLNMKKYAPDIG